MIPMTDYTITNLEDIEDMAAKSGLDFGVVRFARKAVDAEDTGLTYQKIFPGAHQSFGHRHNEAEEVYFVISGSGAVKLDGEVKELNPHDILRVAPHVMRAFEAGPDGLEFIVFGTHHEKDGELEQGYWEQDS